MRKSSHREKLEKRKELSAIRMVLMGLIVAFLIIFIVLDSFISNAFNFGYYKEQYEQNEIYSVLEMKGYNKAEVNAITVNLFNYFKDRGELGDYFNEAESAHMEDVKEWMVKTRIVYFSTIILFLFLLIPWYYVSKRQKKIHKDFSVITLVAGGLLIIFLFFPIFLDFNFVFLEFHRLFFEGNYNFPLGSNIKLLFPDIFFFNITKRILLHTLIKAVALIVVGLVPIFFKLQEKHLKMQKMNSTRLS